MSKYKKERTQDDLLFLEEFGQQLKQLLTNVGITQRAFAETIGTHYNTVNQWINGKAFPEPLLLKKILVFFLTNPKAKNFDIYSLLLGSNCETPQKSQFDSIIENLKQTCETTSEQSKKESDLQKRIEQMKEELKNLRNENRRYKYLEKNKIDYERLKIELEDEKTNYKEYIWERELRGMYNKLLSKCQWYPKTLIGDILKTKDISNLINKYSLNECVAYEDIVKDIKDSISHSLAGVMYWYLKELSKEVKPNV